VLAAAAAIVTASLVALATLSANMEAVFGPIDDHEPLEWMGSDHRLGFTEILPTLFKSTEVGSLGSGSRFRPAYYLVRVTQASFLGDNPGLWYLSVIVVFILTCGLLGLVSAKWLSMAAALPNGRAATALLISATVAFTAIYSGLGAWTGIATRLGPSEGLATLGVAFLLLGLTKLALGASPWWWAVALSGCALACLSKENFAPVVVAGFAMGIYRFATLGRRRSELLLGTLCLTPAVLVALALLSSLSTGEDIYGQETGTSRLAQSLSSLFLTYELYWLPPLAALALSWLAWALARKRRGVAESLLVLAFILTIVTWILIDSWIYSGLYIHERYYMVFQLAKVLMIAGSLALGLAAIRTHPKTLILTCAWVALVATVLLVLSSIRTLPAALEKLSSSARTNADATLAYESDLKQVVSTMSADPSTSTLIVVGSPSDYEPIVAIAQELNRRVMSGPHLFLRTSFSAAQPKDGLTDGLQGISTVGAAHWKIRPIGELGDSKPICVTINGSIAPTPQCQPQSTFNIRARGM
jgi:hypothetical protein